MSNFKFQRKQKIYKGLVVIPAFNEEKVIGNLLKTLSPIGKKYNFDFVVINDGSFDKTLEVVKKSKTKILSHPINRGLGAALGTGFEYARDKNYDILITLDGDGQHDPKEIGRLILPVIKSKADFVVGTRVHKKGMPVTRRILTFLASFTTYFLTGVWTTDSQSGYRVFSKQAIEKIFIEVDRMEVSSDFFRQAREKNLKIMEVPIKPIYTKYSLAKGQSILNSFNIVAKLSLQRFTK